MTRKKQDEPLDPVADPADERAPEFDSTFEEAQQLLQAAVAEIRAWEPPADYAEAHGTPEELGAHRRWRRRVHADTGEHAALTAAETSTMTDSIFEHADPVPVADEAGATEVEASGHEIDAGTDGAAPVEMTEAVEATETDGLETPEVITPSESQAHATAAAAAVADVVTETAVEGAGDDLANPDVIFEKRTPRRRRARASHLATMDSPTADYVLAMEPIEPLGPASEPAPSPSGNRGRRLLVAALVAALVIAGIGVALVAGGGDDEVASPPANVKPRLEFPAETTAEGMEVQRVWELQGAAGTAFTGTLEFTNPTSAPVTTTYTEVIPKSLASSVTSIRFAPQPVVVKADPVVQWTETVQPGQSTTATYEVTVQADGATRERLLKWQEDRDAETGTTTTTTTRPPTETTELPVTPTPSDAPATTAPRGATATTAPRGNPVPAPAPAPPPTAPPEPPPTTPPPPPPPARGSITVQIQTISGVTGTFNFSNGVSLNVGPSGFASSGALAVDAGQYPVTLLNGHVVNIDCSDRDSGPFDQRSTVDPPSATLNVQPGEAVSCTWRVNAE